MIDMTEGEAEYLKYRFKQYLGSVSRAIQNKRLKEQKMEMTIDMIIEDCEQSIKQSELFIKVHQKNMEIGEIKEYQYYIERDKLTIETMRKYQKIKEIVKNTQQLCSYGSAFIDIREVVEDGNN